MKIEYEKIRKSIIYQDFVRLELPIDYNDSVLNFIEKYRDKFPKINHYILRLVLSEDYLSKKDLRLFAVWCARQVEHLIRNKEAIEIIDVSEKHAYGLATHWDLTAAREKSPILDPVDFVQIANLAASNCPYEPVIVAAKVVAADAAKAAASSAARAAARAAANGSVYNSVYNSVYDFYIDSQLDKLAEVFRHYEQKEYNWKNL